MIRGSFVAALLIVASAGGALAERWQASTGVELARGKLEGTEIDERGAVVLAGERTTLWGPEPGIVWDVAGAPDGSIFAALSGPGRVLRIAPDGSVETWYRGDEDTLITAVAPSADGGVYFGLSPDGSVLDLSAPEQIRREYATEATFIWDIGVGSDGTLWAATGLPGSLVVSRDGEPFESLHTTGDDPVRSLAVGDDQVLFGTGGSGRVFRWRDERAYVLFDADGPEIVSLAVGPDGVVYALAAESAKQVDRRAQPPAERTQSNYVKVTASAPEPTTRSEEGEPPKKAPEKRAPSPRLSGSGGGALYRIDPDGAVRRLWRTAAELPFAMVGPLDGRLVIATGDGGALHRVDVDGRSTRLSRIGSSQASALAIESDGSIVVGGTSDARLERLGALPRSSGYYLTEPIDAGAPTRWGRVRPTAEGSAAIEIRVGNSSEPDESWSRWQALSRNEGRLAAPSELPLARFAQLRVELRRGRGALRLSGLELHYRTGNRAPVVERLRVEEPGVAWVRSRPQAASTGGPFVTDDPVTRSTLSRIRRNASGQLRRFYEPGVRTFSWKAQDPDADRLQARLELRREGDESWFELAAAIEDEFFAWDARAVPDGNYRVRLTIADAPDRGPAEQLTDSEVSDLFAIDHTRPTVEDWSVERSGEEWLLRFETRDPGGWIASVELAVDDGPWRPLRSLDGVLDSERERFEQSVRAEGSARPRLRVRVTDHAGNVAGSYDAP